MAPKKRAMTAMVSDIDRAKIEKASEITERHVSEFLRLTATAEAERIIAEHKRTTRRKRRDEDD